MKRLVPLLLLAGCITETGNPELVVDVALLAASTARTIATVAPDTEPGSITVDGAWVRIDKVRLVTGTACDAPGEMEQDLPGLGVVDLASGTPAVTSGAATEDDYCRIRVRLQRGDAGEGPEGFEDHSLLLTGTTAGGASFRLRSRDEPDIDVRSRGEPFTLDEGRADLVLAFDVGVWLDGIDLDSGEAEGDGTILVDEDHNRDLLDAFEDRLDAALELYDDEDGNREVDEDDDLLATSG